MQGKDKAHRPVSSLLRRFLGPMQLVVNPFRAGCYFGMT